MVKKKKVEKITLKSIFRLVVFIIIVFFLINYLDKQKNQKTIISDPTLYVGESLGGQILGEIYTKLPQDSQYQLNHFDQTFLGKFFNNSSNFIKNQLDGFPQKQIKQFKKDLIKNISDDLIKDIDNQ
jgi:hypothetical protein